MLIITGCSGKSEKPVAQVTPTVPQIEIKNNTLVFSNLSDSLSGKAKVAEFFKEVINVDDESFIKRNYDFSQRVWSDEEKTLIDANQNFVKEILFECLKDYKKWTPEKYTRIILELMETPIPDSLKNDLTIKLINVTKSVYCHYFSRNQFLFANDQIISELEKLTMNNMDMIKIYCLIVANKRETYNYEIEKYIKSKDLLRNEIAKESHNFDDKEYSQRNFVVSKVSKFLVNQYYGLYIETGDPDPDMF